MHDLLEDIALEEEAKLNLTSQITSKTSFKRFSFTVRDTFHKAPSFLKANQDGPTIAMAMMQNQRNALNNANDPVIFYAAPHLSKISLFNQLFNKKAPDQTLIADLFFDENIYYLDCSTQPMHRHITRTYLNCAHNICLICDLQDRTSFDYLHTTLPLLTQSRRFFLVLIGLKNHPNKPVQVYEQDIQSLMTQFGIQKYCVINIEDPSTTQALKSYFIQMLEEKKLLKKFFKDFKNYEKDYSHRTQRAIQVIRDCLNTGAEHPNPQHYFTTNMQLDSALRILQQTNQSAFKFALDSVVVTFAWHKIPEDTYDWLVHLKKNNPSPPTCSLSFLETKHRQDTITDINTKNEEHPGDSDDLERRLNA